MVGRYIVLRKKLVLLISVFITGIIEILKKKVSFYYFDYNEKKEKVFRKDKKRYYINPYAMLISNDNYYLIV